MCTLRSSVSRLVHRQIEGIRVCPFCHKPGAGAVPWSQALCVLIVPPRDVRTPDAIRLSCDLRDPRLRAACLAAEPPLVPVLAIYVIKQGAQRTPKERACWTEGTQIWLSYRSISDQ